LVWLLYFSKNTNFKEAEEEEEEKPS